LHSNPGVEQAKSRGARGRQRPLSGTAAREPPKTLQAAGTRE